MESEGKPRTPRPRRRDREKVQQEKQNHVVDSGDEGDESPPRPSKDKGKGKSRRRAPSSDSSEEDIIDGFAIVSFKTLQDLETCVKNSINRKSITSPPQTMTTTTKTATRDTRPVTPSENMQIPDALSPEPSPSPQKVEPEVHSLPGPIMVAAKTTTMATTNTTMAITTVVAVSSVATVTMVTTSLTTTTSTTPTTSPPFLVSPKKRVKKNHSGLTPPPGCKKENCSPGSRKENCTLGSQKEHCSPGSRRENCASSPGCKKESCSASCKRENTSSSCKIGNCSTNCKKGICLPGCKRENCSATCRRENCSIGNCSPSCKLGNCSTNCKKEKCLPGCKKENCPASCKKDYCIKLEDSRCSLDKDVIHVNVAKSPVVPEPVSVTTNGPHRSNSRDRLSDESSHTTHSGRGYICDSEASEDKASDAGSDLFITNPPKRENNNNSVPLINGTSSSTNCSPSPVAKGPPPPLVREPSKQPSASPLTSGSSVCSNSSGVGGCNSRSNSRSASRPNSRPNSAVNYNHLRKPEPVIDRDHNPQNSRPPNWHPRTSTPNHLKPHISRSPVSHPHHNSHTPTFSHPPPQQLHPHLPPPPHHTMFVQPLAAPHLTQQPLPGSSRGPYGVEGLPVSQPQPPPNPNNQDLLRQELNTRFLASQDRVAATAIGPPPYLRTEMHQHQHQHMHQHQHQHMHQHTYEGFPPSLSGSLVPTPNPHVFEKMPKYGSPFIRHAMPGMPATYPGLSAMFHPPVPAPPGASPLSTGVRGGAFQPKKYQYTAAMNHPSSSMQHAQLLMSYRDRDKPMAATPPIQQNQPQQPPQKKTGKWNAIHVKVAWEIYHHQQKQQAEAQKNSEVAKAAVDPLRPPSHLFPPTGSSMHRPPDMANAQNLLGTSPHSRSPFDGGPHPSLFNPGHLGMSPFSRPGAFGGLGGSMPFGGLAGSSLFSRELPTMPGLTSPHEWNRLHRTPPSFPTPPTWPKPDEKDKEKERSSRERELEREREKEREREREREREKERERVERERESRTLSRNSPERRNSIDYDRNRDRSRSELDRPRSRSPIRNGRDDLRDGGKSDSAFDSASSHDSKSNDHRLKDERKDDALSVLNDKRNDLLSQAASAPHPLSMLDRSRMVNPYSHALPERMPIIWNPFERSMDLQPRLDLQKEMERDRLGYRFPNPLGSPLDTMERYKLEHQELLMRERLHAEQRRDMERFAQMEREREKNDFDRNKIPPLKPADPFVAVTSGSSYGRSGSPVTVNHNSTSKSNSPSSAVGGPPPLIPSSAAASQPRSRANSPTATKSKETNNITNSTNDQNSKEKPVTNSTEVVVLEAQSR